MNTQLPCTDTQSFECRRGLWQTGNKAASQVWPIAATYVTAGIFLIARTNRIYGMHACAGILCIDDINTSISQPLHKPPAAASAAAV
jgi:hypothetical protein